MCAVSIGVSIGYPLGVAWKVALSLGEVWRVKFARKEEEEKHRKYSEQDSEYDCERELPQEALRNSRKSQIT